MLSFLDVLKSAQNVISESFKREVSENVWTMNKPVVIVNKPVVFLT